MIDEKTGNLKGRKILVCTTFREFNGNSNDQIQRAFLRGLKDQTYQNYLLVPTIFGEKNVEAVLKEVGVPFKAFHGDAGKYRYSSSQFMENAISLIDEPGKYIVMYTCCDDILDKDFFEKVVGAMPPLSACTSLPHTDFRTLEDLKNNKVCAYTYGGIDIIFFDGDIFLDPEVKKVIKKYRNDGMCGMETFLSGIARVFCRGMYNIYPVVKIVRIDNDRKVNNETSSYMQMCAAHNKESYDAFKKAYGIKGDVFRAVLCYKTSPKYPGVRLLIYYKISLNRLQIIFLRPWLFKLIPRGIKEFLKKFVGKKINYAA